MPSRITGLLLVVLAAGVGAEAVSGQCTLSVPSDYLGGPYPVRIVVCPKGDGDALADAWLVHKPRTQVGQTIEATLLEATAPFAPIVNYPLEDVWITFEGTHLCWCTNNWVHPDASSDAEGKVTFSPSLAAGGWAENPRIVLYVNGEEEDDVQTTNFQITSVDFNCDLVVDDDEDEDEFSALWNANHWRADLDKNGEWSGWDNCVLATHAWRGCTCEIR